MQCLTADQIKTLTDGTHNLVVRLTRLYEPEPHVIYEGPAVVRVVRSPFNQRGRRLPGGQTEVAQIAISRTEATTHWDATAPAWAEHSVAHDLSGNGVLVTEDYQTELFPAGTVFTGPTLLSLPLVNSPAPALVTLGAFINRALATPQGRNDPEMPGVLAAFEQIREVVAITVRPMADGLSTEFDRGFRDDPGGDLVWALRSLLPPEWDYEARRGYASYEAAYQRRHERVPESASPEYVAGATSEGPMLTYSQWYDLHVRPQEAPAPGSPAFARVQAALTRLRDLGRADLISMVEPMVPDANTEEQMERVAALAETLVKGAAA